MSTYAYGPVAPLDTNRYGITLILTTHHNKKQFAVSSKQFSSYWCWKLKGGKV